MSEGFTIKCNNCGTEVKIPNYLELYKINNMLNGIYVTFNATSGISFKCNHCKNILENDP